jgi:hypothetical protein
MVEPEVAQLVLVMRGPGVEFPNVSSARDSHKGTPPNSGMKFGEHQRSLGRVKILVDAGGSNEHTVDRELDAY